MILAGDVGGTKTDLAIFDRDVRLVDRARYESGRHESLRDIVRDFVSTRPVRIEAACFGVAGPVRRGTAKTTNLPWTVSAAALEQILGLDTVRLINDLEATAFGVGALAGDDLAVVHEGAPDAAGHAAVIAAGTGLGEAGLFWDGHRHRPFASEGGHATFAPVNDLELALLTHLRREFDHVSWERVLSGQGLFNIYRFLRDTGRHDEPAWLAEAIAQGDPPAAVTNAALVGTSELAGAALDLFVSLYGSEAGNLALKTYATGGVYVAGGIAPKILPRLLDGAFARAFTAKGRMAPLLSAVPVRVVLSDLVNLLGAARRSILANPDPS